MTTEQATPAKAAPAKNQRTLVGRVVSDKMQKTVTVLVERKVRHPRIGKIITRSSKYHAHSEANEFKVSLAMALHNLGESKQAVETLLLVVAETSQDDAIQAHRAALQFYASDIEKPWR